ncbi:MAG: acyltransferase [Nitrospirae bacterium]|nr:acyltransferase [Nitrospirota bacterium]
MFHKIIKNIFHFAGNILRKAKIAYLRGMGVKIGKNTNISLRAKIDTRRGKIEIGDNCYITYGCIILSHDMAAKRINPNDDGSGRVIIEDNVYIAVNSVILRNVRIGRNSIIGACSVITKDVPPDVVVVGNPQKIIRYLEKR